MTAEEYSPVAGTTIKLVSLSGQLIQYLRNTDETGDSLKCTVEKIKNGGTNTIQFSVDRNTNIPIFPGMVAEVYKDAELFATGYSNSVPQPQSERTELVVQCLGFMHKLKLYTVSKTYSATTLSAIVADLEADLAEVDIYYNASLINLPSVAISSLVFDDKTLFEVVQTLSQIANYAWQTAQYRWFIDNDRFINFEEISQDPIRGLYEGYNYQSPEVEEDDSKIVNRVLLFRTSAADNKVTEYVSTVEDTLSQGQYGIRDKKITFPDYMDTTTIEYFGNAILQRYKDVQTKVGIENLEGVDYPFNFYKISDRIDEYWQLMSECDDLDGWDLTNISDTTVELSTEKVLTGRRSIKATTDDGSFNEYIQLNMDDPIFGPKLFRMYLYLEQNMSLEISLLDEKGVEYTFELGTADFNLDVNETLTVTKHLEVNISAGSNDYGGANYGGDNYG